MARADLDPDRAAEELQRLENELDKALQERDNAVEFIYRLENYMDEADQAGHHTSKERWGELREMTEQQLPQLELEIESKGNLFEAARAYWYLEDDEEDDDDWQ